MIVQPLVPDAAEAGAPSVTPLPATPDAGDTSADTSLFKGLVESFNGAGEALGRANAAEQAFASGHGDLQAMVFERARADALLSIASAAASKATQALNTILNMQV